MEASESVAAAEQFPEHERVHCFRGEVWLNERG